MTKKRILIVGMVIAAMGVTTVGVASGMKGFFFNRIYKQVKADLGLTAEQSQKVDALRDKVKAAMKQQRSGFGALMKEGRTLFLGDTFDDAKANALEAEMNARRDAMHQVVRGALKELHGLLQKDQREKLVQTLDKFRAKMKARWQKHRAEQGK